MEAIGTSHDVMEIESDDENEMEKEDTPGESECSNETTTLKNFKPWNGKFWTVSKTFHAFFIDRGELKLADEFSPMGDKVGKVPIQRRSTQSRLEQYLRAMW